MDGSTFFVRAKEDKVGRNGKESIDEGRLSSAIVDKLRRGGFRDGDRGRIL